MDQGCRNVEFAVGDKVYLKLHIYRQQSLAKSANEKFSPQYFSPFPIVQRITLVAYRLQLPSASSIHPSFHILQLKLALGPDCSKSPSTTYSQPWYGMGNGTTRWSRSQRREEHYWFSGSTYLILKALENLSHSYKINYPIFPMKIRWGTTRRGYCPARNPLCS